MRCDKVMNRDVLYLCESDCVREAATVMREANVGFLPVCDEERRPIGTLTDRDIALRVCADDLSASLTAVTEVMTREVIACSPEAPLTTAEKLMIKCRVSRVLVVDAEGLLVGVISIADVAARDSNKHAAHTLRKIIERETHQ